MAPPTDLELSTVLVSDIAGSTDLGDGR